MREFKIIIVLILGLLSRASSQSAIISNLPTVKTRIACTAPPYNNYDSVMIILTITNILNSPQELLFNAGSFYPWGTFATIINQKTGDTVSSPINREMLSSTLFTEEEMRKRKAFSILKPGTSLTQSYRLCDIAIIKDYKMDLQKGRYSFTLSYFGNISNSVQFKIE